MGDYGGFDDGDVDSLLVRMVDEAEMRRGLTGPSASGSSGSHSGPAVAGPRPPGPLPSYRPSAHPHPHPRPPHPPPSLTPASQAPRPSVNQVLSWSNRNGPSGPKQQQPPRGGPRPFARPAPLGHAHAQQTHVQHTHAQHTHAHTQQQQRGASGAGGHGGGGGGGGGNTGYGGGFRPYQQQQQNTQPQQQQHHRQHQQSYHQPYNQQQQQWPRFNDRGGDAGSQGGAWSNGGGDGGGGSGQGSGAWSGGSKSSSTRGALQPLDQAPNSTTASGSGSGGANKAKPGVAKGRKPSAKTTSSSKAETPQEPPAWSRWQRNDDLTVCTHRMDRAAMAEWLYPSNMEIRTYQRQIVGRALFSNTLVALPTGMGKTFIAAVVMYNYHRWFPAAKIIFMAPTKPLVVQQIQSCHRTVGLPLEHMAIVMGNVSQDLRRSIWRDRTVVFCTAQTLTNDIKNGLLRPERVVLIVVDEAHRAVGKSPFSTATAMIVEQNPHVRILGLSATPGSSVATMQSVVNSLWITSVDFRSEDDPNLTPYQHERQEEVASCDVTTDLNTLKDTLLKPMKRAVDLLRARWSLPMQLHNLTSGQMRKELTKSPTQEARAVLQHLQKLVLAKENLMAYGIPACLDTLLERDDEGGGGYKELNRMMKSWGVEQVVQDALRLKTCSVHPKLIKLKAILAEHFERKQAGGQLSSTRVIVFCNSRVMVEHIVEQLVADNHPLVQPRVFVGQSTSKSGSKGLTQKRQKQVLLDLREGKFNVLVATCIGEEGLDIGEVDLIVHYDVVLSATRKVQRDGRTGRKKPGRVIQLCLRGEERRAEKAKENERSIQKALQQIQGQGRGGFGGSSSNGNNDREPQQLSFPLREFSPFRELNNLRPQCKEVPFDIGEYDETKVLGLSASKSGGRSKGKRYAIDDDDEGHDADDDDGGGGDGEGCVDDDETESDDERSAQVSTSSGSAAKLARKKAYANTTTTDCPFPSSSSKKKRSKPAAPRKSRSSGMFGVWPPGGFGAVSAGVGDDEGEGSEWDDSGLSTGRKRGRAKGRTPSRGSADKGHRTRGKRKGGKNAVLRDDDDDDDDDDAPFDFRNNNPGSDCHGIGCNDEDERTDSDVEVVEVHADDDGKRSDTTSIRPTHRFKHGKHSPTSHTYTSTVADPLLVDDNHDVDIATASGISQHHMQASVNSISPTFTSRSGGGGIDSSQGSKRAGRVCKGRGEWKCECGVDCEADTDFCAMCSHPRICADDDGSLLEDPLASLVTSTSSAPASSRTAERPPAPSTSTPAPALPPPPGPRTWRFGQRMSVHTLTQASPPPAQETAAAHPSPPHDTHAHTDVGWHADAADESHPGSDAVEVVDLLSQVEVRNDGVVVEAVKDEAQMDGKGGALGEKGSGGEGGEEEEGDNCTYHNGWRPLALDEDDGDEEDDGGADAGGCNGGLITRPPSDGEGSVGKGVGGATHATFDHGDCGGFVTGYSSPASNAPPVPPGSGTAHGETAWEDAIDDGRRDDVASPTLEPCEPAGSCEATCDGQQALRQEEAAATTTASSPTPDCSPLGVSRPSSSQHPGIGDTVSTAGELQSWEGESAARGEPVGLATDIHVAAVLPLHEPVSHPQDGLDGREDGQVDDGMRQQLREQEVEDGFEADIGIAKPDGGQGEKGVPQAVHARRYWGFPENGWDGNHIEHWARMNKLMSPPEPILPAGAFATPLSRIATSTSTCGSTSALTVSSTSSSSSSVCILSPGPEHPLPATAASQRGTSPTASPHSPQTPRSPPLDNHAASAEPREDARSHTGTPLSRSSPRREAQASVALRTTSPPSGALHIGETEVRGDREDVDLSSGLRGTKASALLLQTDGKPRVQPTMAIKPLSATASGASVHMSTASVGCALAYHPSSAPGGTCASVAVSPPTGCTSGVAVEAPEASTISSNSGDGGAPAPAVDGGRGSSSDRNGGEGGVRSEASASGSSFGGSRTDDSLGKDLSVKAGNTHAPARRPTLGGRGVVMKVGHPSMGQGLHRRSPFVSAAVALRMEEQEEGQAAAAAVVAVHTSTTTTTTARASSFSRCNDGPVDRSSSESKAAGVTTAATTEAIVKDITGSVCAAASAPPSSSSSPPSSVRRVMCHLSSATSGLAFSGSKMHHPCNLRSPPAGASALPLPPPTLAAPPIAQSPSSRSHASLNEALQVDASTTPPHSPAAAEHTSTSRRHSADVTARRSTRAGHNSADSHAHHTPMLSALTMPSGLSPNDGSGYTETSSRRSDTPPHSISADARVMRQPSLFSPPLLSPPASAPVNRPLAARQADAHRPDASPGSRTPNTSPSSPSHGSLEVNADFGRSHESTALHEDEGARVMNEVRRGGQPEEREGIDDAEEEAAHSPRNENAWTPVKAGATPESPVQPPPARSADVGEPETGADVEGPLHSPNDAYGDAQSEEEHPAGACGAESSVDDDDVMLFTAGGVLEERRPRHRGQATLTTQPSKRRDSGPKARVVCARFEMSDSDDDDGDKNNDAEAGAISATAGRAPPPLAPSPAVTAAAAIPVASAAAALPPGFSCALDVCDDDDDDDADEDEDAGSAGRSSSGRPELAPDSTRHSSEERSEDCCRSTQKPPSSSTAVRPRPKRLCEICGAFQGESGEKAITCSGDGCQVCVHVVGCYGGDVPPEGGGGKWKCEACEELSPQDRQEAACGVCGRSGGALKLSVAGDWAHMTCCLYTPELGVMRSIDLGTRPVGLEALEPWRAEVLCEVCGGNNAVACPLESCGGCKRCVHPHCGVMSGQWEPAQQQGPKKPGRKKASGVRKSVLVCKDHVRAYSRQMSSTSSGPTLSSTAPARKRSRDDTARPPIRGCSILGAVAPSEAQALPTVMIKTEDGRIMPLAAAAAAPPQRSIRAWSCELDVDEESDAEKPVVEGDLGATGGHVSDGPHHRRELSRRSSSRGRRTSATGGGGGGGGGGGQIDDDAGGGGRGDGDEAVGGGGGDGGMFQEKTGRVDDDAPCRGSERRQRSRRVIAADDDDDADDDSDACGGRPSKVPRRTSTAKGGKAVAKAGLDGLIDTDEDIDDDNSMDTAPCAVCNRPTVYVDDDVLFCDGCNMAVHQRCYGVPSIPSGDWLCTRCQGLVTDTTTCALCHLRTGPMLPLLHTDTPTHNTYPHTAKFVHPVCSMWIPELQNFHDEHNRLLTLDALNQDRSTIRCGLCKGAGGVQCADPRCLDAVHPHCARQAGNKTYVLDDQPPHRVREQVAQYVVWCRLHADRNGARRRMEMASRGALPSTPVDTDVDDDDDDGGGGGKGAAGRERGGGGSVKGADGKGASARPREESIDLTSEDEAIKAERKRKRLRRGRVVRTPKEREKRRRRVRNAYVDDEAERDEEEDRMLARLHDDEDARRDYRRGCDDDEDIGSLAEFIDDRPIVPRKKKTRRKTEGSPRSSLSDPEDDDDDGDGDEDDGDDDEAEMYLRVNQQLSQSPAMPILKGQSNLGERMPCIAQMLEMHQAGMSDQAIEEEFRRNGGGRFRERASIDTQYDADYTDGSTPTPTPRQGLPSSSTAAPDSASPAFFNSPSPQPPTRHQPPTSSHYFNSHANAPHAHAAPSLPRLVAPPDAGSSGATGGGGAAGCASIMAPPVTNQQQQRPVGRTHNPLLIFTTAASQLQQQQQQTGLLHGAGAGSAGGNGMTEEMRRRIEANRRAAQERKNARLLMASQQPQTAPPPPPPSASAASTVLPVATATTSASLHHRHDHHQQHGYTPATHTHTTSPPPTTVPHPPPPPAPAAVPPLPITATAINHTALDPPRAIMAPPSFAVSLMEDDGHDDDDDDDE